MEWYLRVPPSSEARSLRKTRWGDTEESYRMRSLTKPILFKHVITALTPSPPCWSLVVFCSQKPRELAGNCLLLSSPSSSALAISRWASWDRRAWRHLKRILLTSWSSHGYVCMTVFSLLKLSFTATRHSTPGIFIQEKIKIASYQNRIEAIWKTDPITSIASKVRFETLHLPKQLHAEQNAYLICFHSSSFATKLI